MKITLCGSTKFMEAFADWNVILTKAGHLVYSVCASLKNDFEPGKDDNDMTKRHFDLVHLAKIEESDAILVLNVGGYFGDSTRREIEWASMRGKEIYWLERQMSGRSVWHLDDMFQTRINGQTGIAKYPETAKYKST